MAHHATHTDKTQINQINPLGRDGKEAYTDFPLREGALCAQSSPPPPSRLPYPRSSNLPCSPASRPTPPAPSSPTPPSASPTPRPTSRPPSSPTPKAATLPKPPPRRLPDDHVRAGIQQAVSSDVVLQVNQAARLDVQLTVGAVSEQVNVTAESPVLDTESAGRGAVIDRTKMIEFPLNGRDYNQLALLSPGVLAATPRLQSMVSKVPSTSTATGRFRTPSSSMASTTRLTRTASEA